MMQGMVIDMAEVRLQTALHSHLTRLANYANLVIG